MRKWFLQDNTVVGVLLSEVVNLYNNGQHSQTPFSQPSSQPSSQPKGQQRPSQPSGQPSGLQTDRQTDRQTRQTDRQTDKATFATCESAYWLTAFIVSVRVVLVNRSWVHLQWQTLCVEYDRARNLKKHVKADARRKNIFLFVIFPKPHLSEKLWCNIEKHGFSSIQRRQRRKRSRRTKESEQKQQSRPTGKSKRCFLVEIV